MLLSGPDSDWSSSLESILKQIRTPYVFIWLDDIFPIEKINPTNFADALDFLIKQRGKHMHMLASPTPEKVTADGQYGIYEKGLPYRCTALGFWNVSYLQSLLIHGETPWNFEVMGSYRSSYADGFYCTMKPLFSSLHVVEKGRIFGDASAYCQSHGIPLATKDREVLFSTFRLRSELQKLYFNSVMHIPWKVRVNIMNVFRKLFISY